jgi:hypothetical protein
MALFSLIAKLGLDKTGFDAGMSAAGKGAARFGAALKSQLAAAFSIAAITAYTRSLIEYSSKIHDAALKTGASKEAMQTLGHAAKLTGIDLDNVTAAMKFLSKSRLEAMKDPNGEEAKVFEALGIGAKELKELEIEDLFRKVGRGFQRNDFGASSMAMVVKLLGRGAENLMPLFVEGVEELEDALRNVGGVLSDEVIDKFDTIHDQLTTLTAQLRGPFADALLGTLRAANAVVEHLMHGIKTLSGFAFGFQKGYRAKLPEEGPVGKAARFIPGLGPVRLITKHFQRVAAGIKYGRELVDFEANREEDPPGEGGLFALAAGVTGKALLKAFKLAPAGRQEREFHFDEKLLKEKSEPKAKAVQADALGRIGGGVGAGGDATQTKLTELVRELKELRRTMESRGITIRGEL